MLGGAIEGSRDLAVRSNYSKTLERLGILEGKNGKVGKILMVLEVYKVTFQHPKKKFPCSEFLKNLSKKKVDVVSTMISGGLRGIRQVGMGNKNNGRVYEFLIRAASALE